MTFRIFGFGIRCPACGVPFLPIGACCTKGPGYYTVADREEWLFNNRSNRPGDDLKDDVCAATATEAWQFWTAQKDRFVKLRQPGPVLVFPTETAVLDPLFQQVRREEELLSLQYRGRRTNEARARGTKRRKQEAETSG